MSIPVNTSGSESAGWRISWPRHWHCFRGPVYLVKRWRLRLLPTISTYSYSQHFPIHRCARWFHKLLVSQRLGDTRSLLFVAFGDMGLPAFDKASDMDNIEPRGCVRCPLLCTCVKSRQYAATLISIVQVLMLVIRLLGFGSEVFFPLFVCRIRMLATAAVERAQTPCILQRKRLVCSHVTSDSSLKRQPRWNLQMEHK